MLHGRRISQANSGELGGGVIPHCQVLRVRIWEGYCDPRSRLAAASEVCYSESRTWEAKFILS